MSLTYGFFDAVYDSSTDTYDRTYTAAQFCEYLKGVVPDGVVAGVGAEMLVRPSSGMDIQVLSGRAFADCRWIANDTALTLTVGTAHATLPRIDVVVVRLDYGSRAMSIEIKAGTPAAIPTAPEAQRDATYYELILAEIAVAAGATAITASDITDKRSDESVCGYVMSGTQSMNVSGDGVSFNTLVTPGVYRCNLGRMLDGPTTLAGIAIMEVVKTGNYVIQRITLMARSSRYEMYMRTYCVTQWNDWVRIRIS